MLSSLQHEHVYCVDKRLIDVANDEYTARTPENSRWTTVHPNHRRPVNDARKGQTAQKRTAATGHIATDTVAERVGLERVGKI